MLWFTIWFMVILKIPALYVAWLIWWAVKDPPTTEGAAAERIDGAGGGPGPRRNRGRSRVPGRRPGPHGSPARRPALPRVAGARARAPRP